MLRWKRVEGEKTMSEDDLAAAYRDVSESAVEMTAEWDPVSDEAWAQLDE